MARPDFDDGPGDNSNSGRILPSPGVYSSPTQIVASF